MDNLEEHSRQKRLRWFGHIARRDEEGRDLGDESGGVSEAANHREENA